MPCDGQTSVRKTEPRSKLDLRGEKGQSSPTHKRMSPPVNPPEPQENGITMDYSLPPGRKKARFQDLYDEVELYRALLRTYTKPLFRWRKALTMSHDGGTLYDFARRTPRNAERLHRSLLRERFHFREGLELNYNFNGRRRTIYLFPWEERIVDLLLYRMLVRHFHGAFSPHSYAYRYRGFGVDFCQHRIQRAIARMGWPLCGFKRDIAEYFPSIDHDILLDTLKEWIEPDDYLFGLLVERVRFRARADDGVKTASRGIPFGTAIACFFANLYLTPLDRRMDAVRGLEYFRYSDDMLAFSASRDTAQAAIELFDDGLRQLKLESKPKHHLNFRFAPDVAPDPQFESIRKFRHLGLEFRPGGHVGLSREKLRKIRNLFRYAFRRARRRFRRRSDPKARAALAIEIARDVVERGFRSVAIIDYYLKHTKDEQQLRLLDRWLAEEVLSRAFENGHKKGNFRHLSFSKLREMGLPSLRHRRRLILHGHLESSFFVLRTERLIEMEKRRRLLGLRTSSPCLKAAAIKTS